MAQKPPAAPKARWADEAADMSPDFRPAIKPKVDPETIYLDDTPSPTAVTHHRPQQQRSSRGGSRHGIFENMSYETTEDELANFLTDERVRFVSIRLELNDRGKSTGVARVEFASPEELDRAMKLTGTNLRGRQVRIGPDSGSRRGNNHGSSSRANSRGGAPVIRDQRPPMRRREDLPKPAATIPAEPTAERKKLVLAPRTVPLEERHYAPTQSASPEPAAEPVKAVEEPVAVKESRDQRRRAPRREQPAPVVATPEKVEDDFVTLPSKKVIKTATPVVREAVPAAATAKAAGWANRFKGLVESESDEQN